MQNEGAAGETRPFGSAKKTRKGKKMQRAEKDEKMKE